MFFKKDQANAKNINPKIINVFSFKFRFTELLKKIKYVKTREKISKGINLDVIKTERDLYFLELNKYLIPIYEFKDKIEEICRG